MIKNPAVAVPAQERMYESFLYSVATAFNLNNAEAKRVIEHIYSSTQISSQRERTAKRLKLHLSKLLIRECVFIVSNGIFGQTTVRPLSVSFGKTSSRCLEMPLSFQVVYILAQIGFDENQLAEILNMPVADVKQKMAKARNFNQIVLPASDYGNSINRKLRI